MAKLLKISNQETMNEVLTKLVPSWKGCFSQTDIEKAQVAGSQSRKFIFGVLMNEKFIKLSKACAGHKAGDIVSLADIYEVESASNIASLIIYRLASSGYKKPVVVEA